jgi:thiol-disulfide isomerase/thioredoxin
MRCPPLSRFDVPALATLLALGVAFAGCSRSSSPHAASGTTAVSSAAADTTGPPLVPITAAEIQARAAAGGPILINVWATWCGPCREEFPALLAVARAHRSQGLRLMLVSADFEDQAGAVRKFLAGYGVRDTSFMKTGDDQAFINQFHSDWTGAIPATLVLDAHGKVVAFWEGRADSLRFETAVSRALAASRAVSRALTASHGEKRS